MIRWPSFLILQVYLHVNPLMIFAVMEEVLDRFGH